MRIKYIYFLTFLFLLCACGESKYENNIPYKDVRFTVYPLTDFNKILTSPGGIGITKSCNHNGGQSCCYKDHGIFVCRMLTSDSYAAYAATCPIDLSKLEIVNEVILKVKCGKCNRIFELDNNGLSGNVRLLGYRIQMSIANLSFLVTN
ncbi:MAG: hypothetical protein LBH30_03655 [Prevotellaceae bacterium]|jgi:hypothetical protein|nr:hypothetical protein [Prevotellaceae bacterium]